MTYSVIRNIALVSALCAGVAACAPQPSNPDIYSPGQANAYQTVQMGMITSVRMVQIRANGDPSNSDQIAGGVIGALAGTALGSQFGRGDGRTLMTGIGAVGGALAGSQLAMKANRSTAPQWTVQLDNGSTITVIQSGARLHVGARVEVLFEGGQARLLPR